MSKLSSLEKKALKNVFDKLKAILIVKNRDVDSINDCLTDQIEIVNHEGDQEALNRFVEYSKVADKNLSEIFDSLDDLAEHFLD